MGNCTLRLQKPFVAKRFQQKPLSSITCGTDRRHLIALYTNNYPMLYNFVFRLRNGTTIFRFIEVTRQCRAATLSSIKFLGFCPVFFFGQSISTKKVDA